MGVFFRVLRALPLLLFSPLLILLAVVVLAAADLIWLFRARRRLASETAPAKQAASVVIPNWNGRDLLEKYLPSVVAALEANPENEILVVDNASEDGSVAFVRERFPRVKVLEMPWNLGFGGACNAGARAAANDIVMLLNNDMRVEPDFLSPLLEGFADEKVFSVSCQIFFTNPEKAREETGLTQGWWESGSLRVRHRIDEGVKDLYPCFYGGGGSMAIDRRKFLELGGFDRLLAPFYLEDTDLGYMAWKRGWKVMYEPRSVVYHEHRGTIGRRFSAREIELVLEKNFILWSWKNIHEWPRLASHFFYCYSGALVSVVFGKSPERPTLAGLWRACRQLPRAARSRWNARDLAAVDDIEAFRRPLGGYFRDRFATIPTESGKLRVLFVSPYPIVPPIHGGGVFMYQTLQELVRHCEVHLVVLLHYPHELAAHDCLRRLCASAEFLVKTTATGNGAGSILPHAVREYANSDLEWLIHRQIQTREIDIVQLEYTPMGQYAGVYRHVVNVLFEHDIYFQSIARGWKQALGAGGKLKAAVEYLRALRYETGVLERMDRIQTCSAANRDYLLSFVPDLDGRVQDGLRAGIDTFRYNFRPAGREPATMLFLGSFRHLPNQTALDWFIENVLPLVRERRPECRLVVVGSELPPPHSFSSLENVELAGYVDDIREPLERYSVFVCPILSGSGVRVKLLEAFAAGIPVVSTRLGAEGLASDDGEFCALADDPATFAAKILDLFEHPEQAAKMAARARSEVVEHWDMEKVTAKLEASYREAVREKRTPTCRP
jgi:O-antigen biosynthesis protein